MIAHVGGLPVEELLVPFVLATSVVGCGVRALLAQWRRPRRPFEK
jgi:hypothetical protein